MNTSCERIVYVHEYPSPDDPVTRIESHFQVVKMPVHQVAWIFTERDGLAGELPE